MSDTRSAEHRAADDALLEAIQNVVRLQDKADIESENDEVVMEYVVVARCDSFGNQERGTSTYALATKDSGHGPLSSPSHSVVGLLHFGLDYLRGTD